MATTHGHAREHVAESRQRTRSKRLPSLDVTSAYGSAAIRYGKGRGLQPTVDQQMTYDQSVGIDPPR